MDKAGGDSSLHRQFLGVNILRIQLDSYFEDCKTTLLEPVSSVDVAELWTLVSSVESSTGIVSLMLLSATFDPSGLFEDVIAD
ncbi:unnamed protein product [Fusarium graminearum]|nr:unnamed protein product [Fusarium graminearum]CAG1966819.1 unnamed protein product [Fusarium graminearum]VTO91009.1 unnamed protein product [Fusarium graminearum]